MVATAATSAFFITGSSSSAKSSSTTRVGGSENLDVCSLNSPKPAFSRCGHGLKTKVNAQAASPKINGTTIAFPTKDEVAPLPSLSRSRTFNNPLTDWSMLLTTITAMFLAADNEYLTLVDSKPRTDDTSVDQFGLGKMIQDGLVYRQDFSIKSYEIGADGTASIESLMNHLQETALNHCKMVGLMNDGFGCTPEMSQRDLIWVIAKTHIVVDRFPTWGDVVQVDTYVGPAGKNGMRRDWVVSDFNTGETLARATSVCVMMNKTTRRLSKIPDEVRAEIIPNFIDLPTVVDEDTRKLVKLDEDTSGYVISGLAPRWNDLDMNQHVNNVKYIGWILEGVPVSILENHELCSLTLEYRKECGRDSILQSLTSVNGDALVEEGKVECDHMLRLESGAEIVRARTNWRPKFSNRFGSQSHIPSESM